MASNSVSIAWLLPLMALAPMGLTHCIESTEMDERADSGQMKAPPDAGEKTQGDSGMKTQDSGMKTQDDSGMKTQDDGSSKEPEDGASPTGDDGGPATPADAGGAPHVPGSVPCNGAPCDVSHGSFCCVTWTRDGITEVCNPPHSACLGHTVACDEQADCDNGVCCQDFPSGGFAGSASCKESCDAIICH
ncbi:MAG: hypothetical protein ACLP1X_20945 [Polyangiaceae bacterium]|jgi:hypothetical protein